MKALLLAVLAVGPWACQQPASSAPLPAPGLPEQCLGHGPDCTEMCCDEGYACQEERCIDGTSDMDTDGYPAYLDCDDFDPDTYPTAIEVCDRRDNNCNGEVDEGVRNAQGDCIGPCEDLDQDEARNCDGDCDDTDPEVHPDAEEICDGKDNNCDGTSDEGFDVDGDGYGACGEGGDCDDDNPLVAPGFNEVCDGLDNDCANGVDDGNLCGLLGECAADLGCTWGFDPATDETEHADGYPDGLGAWCAGPDQPANFILVAAPNRGMRDMPYGVYLATVSAKVSDNETSWGSCGTALRLRANDRDADGSGTCRNCYFGGDVALVPRHFAANDTYQEWVVNLSIGPEREHHLVEIVVLRGSCAAVEVCVDSITIVEG